MTEQREQQLLARIAELEAEIEKLRRELGALKERNQQLEQELRRKHRQATPYAKERPKADPKRPGRKPGEGPFAHRNPPRVEEVHKTVRVPLPHCPKCGGPLRDRKCHEQYQEDLEVRKVVTRYETESGYCTHCQQHHHSRAEEQTGKGYGAAKVSLGPWVRALFSDAKHRLGVPYEKISDLLKTHFGFGVTRSGLCQADLWLAEQAQPVYQELVMAIREASVVHVDETGWRIGTLSSWLWVFTGQQITVYEIDERRSHEVVVEVLGRQFAGTLSCDCFTAYDHSALSDWLQQKCLAHLLDDLSEMKASKTGRALQFAREVTCLLRQALKLRDLKEWISPSRFYRKACRELEMDLDVLIAPQRRFTDADNARMAKRLRKQRNHVLRFLYHDEIDPTNNLAERMLRPAVIMRKTCRCNKTERGAKAHKVLASVFVTCRQQQRDIASYVTSLLQGRAPSLVPSPSAHPP